MSLAEKADMAFKEWLHTYKGQTLELPDCALTILGGGPFLHGVPNSTSTGIGRQYVTCDLEGTYVNRFGQFLVKGEHKTILVDWSELLMEPAYRDRRILSAECPECGIEEMIFYEGDYICAWCREQLEDGHLSDGNVGADPYPT